MSHNPVSFKIGLNEKAKALIEKLSNRQALCQPIKEALDSENTLTVGEIQRKLHVAGNTERGRRETASHNYPYPHMISQKLWLSIGKTKAIVEDEGGKMFIRSAVGSGVGQGAKPVRYARIHEFGGKIKIPSRQRVNTVQAGIAFGKPTYRGMKTGRFASMTKAYEITIPKRAYIRPTIEERTPRYVQRVSGNIITFLRGGRN